MRRLAIVITLFSSMLLGSNLALAQDISSHYINSGSNIQSISTTTVISSIHNTYYYSTVTSSWVNIQNASSQQIQEIRYNGYYNNSSLFEDINFNSFATGTLLRASDSSNFVLFYYAGNNIISLNQPLYDPNYSTTSAISLVTPISQTFLNNPIFFSGTYTNADTYNKLNFSLEYTTYGQTIYIADTDIALLNGHFNWSKSIIIPYIGDYIAKVRLYDSVTSSTTAWSNSVSFGLASTTIKYQPVSTSTLDFLGTESCSLTDIYCHFKNVLIVLFQPTTASVQQFGDLKTVIENKPPFGYFTMLKTNMENLSASTTAVFNIVIPTYLKNAIFDPLKTGIASILWLFGLVLLYKRLTNIQL